MAMDQRVIIMHGLSYAEIDLVMRAVKKELERPRDIIFAKTTDNSLTMKVGELIEDLSQDHEYLKNNPPEIPSRAESGDS
ncbi:MAG: DUF3783 domain-containing protein [Spirochaetales bacterium]|nr:DUF3783 domain-containing protein [Spirochaetales bacterium]